MMTDNIMTIKQINAMQELLQMQRKPIRAPSLTDSLTRQLPCNQTVTIPGSQLKPITRDATHEVMNHHETSVNNNHLVCKINYKS